jgi:hypothetical protein
MASRPTEYLRERQAAAREMGRCIWCGEAAASPEGILCGTCLASKATAYLRAKAASRCTKCGEPADGSWACEACRDRANDRRRERRGQRTHD